MGRLFDFEQRQIKPEGLHEGWQTGGTVRLTRLAFARLVKTAMNTSMRYAMNKKIISVNPTSGVELPKRVEKKKYHTRSIDEKRH